MINFNIKTDSRAVKEGDIFVALKTVNSDGHLYISKAIENGAKTIVCNRGEYEGVEVIKVEDTRAYLVDYLLTHFKKYLDEMTIIGFTGTNGKSTSVHFIYQALNLLDTPCASVGTIGFFTKQGFAKATANTSPDICDLYDLLITAYNEGHRHVAIETSSHGFAFKRLEGIEYSYAAFTNLTRDHLDYHKTMENYAACKHVLFERVRPTGLAMQNFDDPHCNTFIVPENRNLTFGFTGGDIQVTKYEMTNEGSSFTLNIEGKEYDFFTQVIGKYNISNMIPIIIFLKDMGFAMEDIQRTIPQLTAPDGRIDTVTYGTNKIYIDYAHTPDGMEKVMKSVNEVTKGNTYCVFCCSGNRDRGKRPEMMELGTTLAKYAIVTADNYYGESFVSVLRDMISKTEADNFEVIFDRRKAIQRGIDLLEDNDSLLILGRGHEKVFTCPDKSKIHFYDKEEAQNYVNYKEAHK